MATAPFAEHHALFWQWVWRLRLGEPSDPLVVILPRGGAKSSSAESANIVVGARGTRRYGLYVSETQEQADKHLNDIGLKLESSEVARYYPAMANRALGKYGAPRGWRRNRLSTASGFVIDALGLEVAARGLKFGDQRPDLITLDDIDGLHDTEATRQKKIETLTQSVLPAMAPDAAVLAVQNLIHQDSIFAQLADGRADFLHGRTVIGPYPAAYDLAVEFDPERERYVVTGGTALWVGQDLPVIEHQINQWGLGAFLREAQQEVNRDPEDAAFKREHIEAHRVAAPPSDLIRVVIGVDPSFSLDGDETGIVAAGLSSTGHAYILNDYSLQGTPDAWAQSVIRAFIAHEADRVIAEANLVGLVVETTLRTLAPWLPITPVRATRGKLTRAEPIAALYEQGRVHHVGRLPALEDQMCHWRPGIDKDSPDRMDALVWAVWALLIDAGEREEYITADEIIGDHRVRIGG